MLVDGINPPSEKPLYVLLLHREVERLSSLTSRPPLHSTVSLQCLASGNPIWLIFSDMQSLLASILPVFPR